MRLAILLAMLLALAPGALGDPPAPKFRVVLSFPDGSVEICIAPAFTLDYLAINLTVDACYPDVIFDDGFEDQAP